LEGLISGLFHSTVRYSVQGFHDVQGAVRKPFSSN